MKLTSKIMNNRVSNVLIAETVLSEIEKKFQDSKKQFSDEDLLTLHSVYGPVLQRALDILEKHSLIETYSTVKQGRVLIEIKGDHERCYRLFPRLNYCACTAFKDQVIEKRIQITCKHVLAGRIGIILGKTVNREVTQEQYLMLLQSMLEIG